MVTHLNNVSRHQALLHICEGINLIKKELYTYCDVNFFFFAIFAQFVPHQLKNTIRSICSILCIMWNNYTKKVNNMFCHNTCYGCKMDTICSQRKGEYTELLKYQPPARGSVVHSFLNIMDKWWLDGGHSPAFSLCSVDVQSRAR